MMHMLYSTVFTLQVCLLDNHCIVHHVEVFTISPKAVEGFLFMLWLIHRKAASCVGGLTSVLLISASQLSQCSSGCVCSPSCLCFRKCVCLLGVPGIVCMFNSCGSSCINHTVFASLTLFLSPAAWSQSHSRKCDPQGISHRHLVRIYSRPTCRSQLSV